MGAFIAVIAKLVFALLVVAGTVVGTNTLIKENPVPPAVPAAPKVSENVETKLTDAQAALALAKQTGKPVAVELTFTDAQLTDFASRYSSDLSFNGISLKDTVIACQEDFIELNGTTTLPFNPKVKVLATPGVVADKLQLEVTRVSVAGINANDDLRNGLKEKVRVALEQLISPQIQVKTVKSSPGKITVSARALP